MERVMPVDFATLISWRGLSVWMVIMRVLLLALVRRSACYNVDTEQPLIFVGKSESYFGTTAEIVIDSQKWILVGATKDNFTDKPEIPFPGNVYACPVDFLNSNSNCTVLPNLRTSEAYANVSEGVFEESDQMLGASIIVPENSAKPIKICAPKWKNLRFFRPDAEGDNTYQVTGNCFVLNDRSDLINTAKTLSFRIPKDDFDYYKAPLIGFSIADTKIRVFDTLYGAPNIGRGSTGGLLAKNDGNVRNAKSMKLEVERSKVVQDTYLTGSLFGYSIAPGNLGGVTQDKINFHFVVGAPGFSNKNGVIGAFSVLQFGTAFQQVKQIEGMQVGGGFGQTLCIADVNGDKNDEILVAAPNWFSMGDQGNQVIYDVGVVYVYYGTGSASIIDDTAQEIRGSLVRFSRFGTAISNIGDINKDGYNDIAIGAPFENKEGAVYIFNGGKTRLEDMYSQKIIGSRVKTGLQGFGWYISRTARDLDDNLHNDFVVGAYRSDTAVLLRTRNIIDVNCEISYTPDPIPLNSSGTFCNVDFNPCFNVSLCFNFTGEGINKTNIDFSITIDANETRKRAAMTNGSHRFEELTVRDFTIFSFKSSCYSFELTVENIDRRFFQVIERPISLRGDYNISNIPVDPGTVKAILRRGISASFFGQVVPRKALNWSDYVHVHVGCPQISFRWFRLCLTCSGNDAIHTLTKDKNQELRVDLQSFSGEQAYAVYSTFYIGDENNKYILTVSGYSGTAGDSLTWHSGSRFSTKDQDNDYKTDGSCAVMRHGAWWYSNCLKSNLNGEYAMSVAFAWNYPVWEHWRGSEAMKKTVMMIRNKI
ncbi:integrin alpha-4-like [Saccostrea cucullata]|uniref:integrin alpha-4-like n=1 Tax=Saccostrea cuccullata TaxID=36930 RepID=UPI002ED23504